MSKNKPIIGILATPFIKNNNSCEIFLSEDVINFLKKNLLDYIIIPYNLKKSKLNKILNKIDGIIFPGGQLGNYYNNKYIKQHFLIQKYLVNQIKKINKERHFPILGICHGYTNLILIEINIISKKMNDKKIFTNVNSYNGYKTIPKFTKNNSAQKFKKIYNTKKKTKKIIHNNSLALSFNKTNKLLLKNYDIIATSADKNNIIFIDIVKHKKYPFYGFQGHPERNNSNLLIPFLKDIKLYNTTKNNNLKTIKLYKNSKQIKCAKKALAKKTSKRKCYFYKI